MSDAPVLGDLNLVEDFGSAEDFAKKHTPYIEVCGKEDTTALCITVGNEVPHPNEPDHFIEWIMVYAGESPIARFDLSPVATEPTVSLVIHVDPGTTVRAVAHCNLHGLWAYEVTV